MNTIRLTIRTREVSHSSSAWPAWNGRMVSWTWINIKIVGIGFFLIWRLEKLEMIFQQKIRSIGLLCLYRVWLSMFRDKFFNSTVLFLSVEDYITVAKEKYGYNGEQALGMLFWHKHDLERAVMDLANFTPFPDEWTIEDKVLFEQAFQFHGKSFHRIRQMVSYPLSVNGRGIHGNISFPCSCPTNRFPALSSSIIPGRRRAIELA